MMLFHVVILTLSLSKGKDPVFCLPYPRNPQSITAAAEEV
jgi:hypothetical protein